MKRNYIILIFSYLFIFNTAQTTKNILFLGNSYTEVNNLPSLLKNVAISTGKNIIYDSNTPGGYTLQDHYANTTSINKIQQGNWDFVVLQEQSQIPSFPDNYVNVNMFPYAKKLDSLINKNNTCAETLFYMTWGRKNGDASNCASNPAVCTYIGMDNLLKSRYEMMANQNNAVVSPVGAVWRYIRNNYPAIELYSSDESHPSLEGSYAAACTFYTVIFRDNPNNISYNANLNPTVAEQIRNATKAVVFDQLSLWNVGKYDLDSSFSSSAMANNPLNIQFTSTFLYEGATYFWDFGDGQTSTQKNPNHFYNNGGNYSVKLTLSKCGETSSKTITITVNNLGINEIKKDIFGVFPNPVHENIMIIGKNNFLYFEIYDRAARKVQQGMIHQNKISVGSLTTGNYTLILKDNVGNKWTKSFIKNKENAF